MNLRYDVFGASVNFNQNRRAYLVMRELGIKYLHATPQTMGGQWWFWGCTNVPEKLPAYIDLLGFEPNEAIGYGLDQEMADKIIAGYEIK